MQSKQMTAQVTSVAFLFFDTFFSVFSKMLSAFLLTLPSFFDNITLLCIKDYTRVGAP